MVSNICFCRIAGDSSGPVTISVVSMRHEIFAKLSFCAGRDHGCTNTRLSKTPGGTLRD